MFQFKSEITFFRKIVKFICFPGLSSPKNYSENKQRIFVRTAVKILKKNYGSGMKFYAHLYDILEYNSALKL